MRLAHRGKIADIQYFRMQHTSRQNFAPRADMIQSLGKQGFDRANVHPHIATFILPSQIPSK